MLVNLLRGTSLLEFALLVVIAGIMLVVSTRFFPTIIDHAHQSTLETSARSLVDAARIARQQWQLSGESPVLERQLASGRYYVRFSRHGWPVAMQRFDHPDLRLPALAERCMQLWYGLLEKTEPLSLAEEVAPLSVTTRQLSTEQSHVKSRARYTVKNIGKGWCRFQRYLGDQTKGYFDYQPLWGRYKMTALDD